MRDTFLRCLLSGMIILLSSPFAWGQANWHCQTGAIPEKSKPEGVDWGEVEVLEDQIGSRFSDQWSV